MTKGKINSTPVEEIPIGTRVKVLEIHEDDAYFENSAELIGQVGEVIQDYDGTKIGLVPSTIKFYWQGRIAFDRFNLEWPPYFYAIKVEVVK